jgi:hypothetical protein
MDVYQGEIGTVRDEVTAAQRDGRDLLAESVGHVAASLAEVSSET